MPVFLNANSFGLGQSCAEGVAAQATGEDWDPLRSSLHIGLVNNMQDGALLATERQFISLLEAAGPHVSIKLSLYSLPGIDRGEAAQRHMKSHYLSTESLWGTQLDGLIVAGREPSVADLRDEPFWGSFTKLLDWAQENTHSAVWSCLAAHAAVLHLNGVKRIRGAHKYWGILDCDQLTVHPLTAGTPDRFKLPHSRWNGLSEKDLTDCGFEVLTRSVDAGVDTFVKQQNSLFVFFQGHPEYQSNTLLLEYRRDVERYIGGKTDRYPILPLNYFDSQTEDRLRSLQEQALSGGGRHLLAKISAALTKTEIENKWQSTAVCIYRNWLQYLWLRKGLRLSNNWIDSPDQILSRF